MVFSRMKLTNHPSYSRLIPADHYEHILCVEPQMDHVQYDLNMGQPLDSRAYFILAFDYKDATRFQHALRLYCGPHVQFKDGVVPLVAQLWRAVPVRVMIPERRMRTVSRKGIVATIETFHIRWVKHNTVDLAVMIGELATVGARLDVCWKKFVFTFGDILPEYALTKSHVSNFCSAWDVEPQDMGKHLVVVRSVSRKDEFCRRPAVRRFPLYFHSRHFTISLTCAQAVFSWSPRLFLSRSRILLQFRLLDQVVSPKFLRFESSLYDQLTYPCRGHSQELGSGLGCVEFAHAL